MKQLLLTLLAALLLAAPASAQRLRIGVRGGINTTDYRFAPLRVGDTYFTAGPSRRGFEAGFVFRINCTQVFHLQTELDYDFVNHLVRATRDQVQHTVRMRSERLELPLQLGFQFGPVRLFGGASFRLNSVERSSHPDLLQIDYGSDRIAWLGGLGLNIRHFFVDFRVQGYPGPKHRSTFLSEGAEARVRLRSDLIMSGSLGFFF